eukprot:SAG22_NODE_2418_length_2597_cov_2.027622_1_plen_246_part_00
MLLATVPASSNSYSCCRLRLCPLPRPLLHLPGAAPTGLTRRPRARPTDRPQLLNDAQRLCYEKNHNLVEPCHAAWVLFAGAAINPIYETGSRILARAKVQDKACRAFLEEELSLCDTDRPAADVSYSHSFVEFLKEAVFEAEAYRDSLIGLDHLAIALAISLSEYGQHVGFNEHAFRAASEAVRGIAQYQRPAYDPDSPTDSNGSSGGSLGIDLDSYSGHLLAGLSVRAPTHTAQHRPGSVALVS